MEPPLLGLDPVGLQGLMDELGPLVENAVADGGPRNAVDAFSGVVCSSFRAQADDATRNQIRDNAPMLIATLEREAAEITPDVLAGIEHPVLVMAATDSPQVHRTINHILMELLPNASFVEFDDCGHVIYAEKPAEFARAVRAFAREITAPTPTASRSQ